MSAAEREAVARDLYHKRGWSGCAGSAWERVAEVNRRPWYALADQERSEPTNGRAACARASGAYDDVAAIEPILIGWGLGGAA